MATIIFSDQMNQPYSEWVTDGLQAIAERKPKSIGLVALCENGEVLTGYWETDTMQKTEMAQHVQADYIDQLVSVNFTKYMQENGIEIGIDDSDDI
jgi:hypothetical protein